LIRAPPIRNPDSKSLDSSSKDFTSMKSIPGFSISWNLINSQRRRNRE
jgi:hypothetical protein